MTEAQAQRLGQLILRARTRHGWSLATLQEHTGIPDVWLNRVERGLYLQPAPERLAKVAEALEIDPMSIDRASQNHLAQSLPSVRTYFRSTAQATSEQLDEIETAIAEIQAKHAGPSGTDQLTGKPNNLTRKGGTP
jgi:transcriptional regulator with XRE-family HTH domain